MSWRPRQLGRQTGRSFFVTGANSGIGLEAARELVGRGAHVVLAVCDTAKGEQAAARLAGSGSTSVVELDLSDLDQVAGCAETLLDRHDELSALICNAGVMGGPFLLTAQGFERQMATNHLGHAALVTALWPLLHASAARVVLVSSTEARGGQLSPQTTGGAAAQPGAVRRPAGLPEHQAGQPAVRAGAAPPLCQGRFAGQRRRRAPGRQRDQPVRPRAMSPRAQFPVRLRSRTMTSSRAATNSTANGPPSGSAAAPQCTATPRAIAALLSAGHPAAALLYYRGGIHDWVTLGLPLLKP